jgi:hypothetical protein
VDPVSWDKAKDLLFAALERAAEEREAFVRERCSDPTTCDEITITGASLGHPLSAFANNGEWNLSGTVGFDLRRIGGLRRPAP